MKNVIASAGLALAFAMSPAQAAQPLNVYVWSGYLPPELIKQFEKEFDATINVDNYDSNETLLSKLKLGGGGYDIVFPDTTFVPVMIQEGLLTNVDAKALPGYDNLLSNFQKPSWDPTGDYTVPFSWGTTAFAVDTDVYKGDINTYQILFNPPDELKGKINVFDSPVEVVAQASVFLGLPQCSSDPKEMQKVADLLAKQKPYVKTYSSKAGAIRESLVARELAMSTFWSGSTQRTRKLRSAVKYAYPVEGVVGFSTVVAVPTGAKNIDLAKKFMEFAMRPETAATISNTLNYQNAVKGSEKFMDAELSASPEMNPPKDRKVIFMETCSPESTKLQDRLWTNLMK